MADNVNGHGGTVGFDDLPYFQDYLQNVLRPRVERAIESVTKSLTETAWKQVLADVAAADEPGKSEIATALLRPLIENKLGLRMETKLASQFGAAKPPVKAPAGPSAIDLESDSGVTRVGGPNGADVVTVRRQPVVNPLANAVVNSRTVGR